MRIIKLKIDDTAYDNILFLLKNSKYGIEIIEDVQEEDIDIKNRLKSILHSKDIELFKDIKDPVKWQKELREEWDQ